MQKFFVLFGLFVSAAAGQYTWHSTATTFPPSDPPFEALSAYNYGYGGVVSRTSHNDSAEVRTVIIRTATGLTGTGQYSYEHLLG